MKRLLREFSVSTMSFLLTSPYTAPHTSHAPPAIFAGVRGYLDKIDVGNVNRFEASLLAELRSRSPDILASIRDKRELTSETEEKLKTFVETFAKTFV